MFGWEIPPYNSGGLGVACRGLARALSQLGVEVCFVLPKRLPQAPDWARFMFADGAVAFDETFSHTLHAAYVTQRAYAQGRAAHVEAAQHFGVSLLDEVRRYAAYAGVLALAETFDLIHAHDWLTYPAALSAKHATGTPLILHVHATEFDRTGFGEVNQDVYEIERRAFHEADRIIAVSRYTKNIIARYYGVPPAKIDVVHNGIDQDDSAVLGEARRELHALKAAGRAIVLFVGRLTLQKGPDHFLRAARRVLDHCRDAVFVMSGSGDLERQVIEQAASLGIGDRVHFVGFLRDRELARLYGMADVVVMPSVSEPFGIVPLEALLNGTPVVLSKQSGVAEVLPHALMADFWDIDELANKILAAVAHPPLRETLVAHGVRSVHARSWRHAAQQCRDVYDSVLAT